MLAERYKKERFEEGQRKGRREGQRDLLDRLVKMNKLTPEEKREIERELERRDR